YVQDELGELALLMGLVDPPPGEVHQQLQVLLGAEGLGLETRHLTGGSRLVVLGATTEHSSQGGIEAKALGVVDILVASQSAVDRLAGEGQQTVWGVLSRAGVVQAGRRRTGQSEGIVEFAVGEESGVTGDGRAVELQLDLAIEIDAHGVVVAVTHWVPLSFRQEVVGNAGFSGEKAQTPCRNDRAIWEIRDKRTPHPSHPSSDR